jgi:hypothetical protein
MAISALLLDSSSRRRLDGSVVRRRLLLGFLGRPAWLVDHPFGIQGLQHITGVFLIACVSRVTHRGVLPTMVIVIHGERSRVRACCDAP